MLLENIHVHLAHGEPKARGVLEASREVAIPRLLAMLSVLSVFLPSFFMVGPAQALFVPLSLAVGFAMGASYLLSSSLVPVLSHWLLQAEKVQHNQSPQQSFNRFRERFFRWLDRLMEPVLRCCWLSMEALLSSWCFSSGHGSPAKSSPPQLPISSVCALTLRMVRVFLSRRI